ncbi:MAG: hypothetical protein UH084_00870 [Paludibacteraceae bacterium]|nr:hypothetical protein [Paludibacteraceae bacterium]
MIFDSLLNKPIKHRHKINDIQGLSEELEQKGGGGTPNMVVSITYSELKVLRDNNNLTPGIFYRILDYTTAVANDTEARSAGHLFDVVVLAISSNVLSEEALAVKSDRDTEGYFGNANLSAWKIWYCLDNDIYRFTWADVQLGTGVIYRMIDEWGNDCPYDFKNVQFKRYIVSDDSANGELECLNGTYIGINAEMHGLIIDDVDDYTWAYTFSLGDRTQTSPIDMSMIGFNSPDIGSGYGFKGYYGNNVIRPCSCSQAIDDIECSAFCLNNIVWFSNNNKYRSISGTTIEAECCNMTLSGNGTKIGYDNQSIIMGDACFQNIIESGCCLITFGQYCHDMQFGQGCVWLTFGQDCRWLTFGQYCNNMQFGQYCNSMQFGQDCGWLTFGQGCSGMQFGQNCWYMQFGQNVRYIIFDNNIYNIEIPNNEDSSYIQNAHIFNGVHGNDSVNKLVINLAYNVEYTQFVAMKSDGSVRIWNPADVA